MIFLSVRRGSYLARFTFGLSNSVNPPEFFGSPGVSRKVVKKMKQHAWEVFILVVLMFLGGYLVYTFRMV